ncbi:MAG TPA: hypothetical protein VKU00_00680 [Chthonomonadaceae bacterium]|nr:hypothetical protein [Chthonomonadaceae bacterium]
MAEAIVNLEQVGTLNKYQVLTSNSPSDQTVQAFTGGTFASVTVPANTTGVFIVPQAGNTGAITLKGVTGDTGVALNKTQPSFIALDAGAAFGILCANSISITFNWV